MAKQRKIEIAKKLRRSRIYFKLEGFLAFFGEGILVEWLIGKIRKSFVVLERRINRILRKMRKRGAPDGKRMDFWRIVRKFLPAFSKVWSLNA